MNQHLKLKHNEYYQQLCSSNQINPVALSNKHDSSMNDGKFYLALRLFVDKSLYSNSYENEKGRIDEEDDEEDEDDADRDEDESVENQVKKQISQANKR